MIYDILEQKLTAEGFKAGKDMFRTSIPANVSVAIMTKLPLEGMPIDPYIEGYYKGRMQVVIRHTAPAEGNVLAARVQRALTQRGGSVSYPATRERGEVTMKLFYAETLPIFFPRLDGHGFEWSQHFMCVFSMKALHS